MDIIADSDASRSPAKGTDMYIGDLLQRVFVDTGQGTPPSKLSEVENFVNVVMDGVVPNDVTTDSSGDFTVGRIGPRRVRFDLTSKVGLMINDKERLGVCSQSNFSTIRANVCVYSGRWQYELMLGSKGVMQLGWTTLDAFFSQEKGVGDTADSYAYDGNRVRKWNVATNAYGEAWLTGDVIGCTIDLDRGHVGFYRNGRFLGDAFTDIRTGPGVAYFPAVSLAFSENLVANFGATPLKHPVDGFRPLQEAPHADMLRARQCLGWTDRMLALYPQDEVGRGSGPKSALVLVGSHVFHHLGPLLRSPYVVEAAVIPFLKDGANAEIGAFDRRMSNFLDLLWMTGEDQEIRDFLQHLAIGVLVGYRFAPVDDDYELQKSYLRLMVAILEHRTTRHFLLSNILFDKVKFPIFLHVKPPDDEGLCRMIPHVWWDGDEDQQVNDTLTSDEESVQSELLGSHDGLKPSEIKGNYFAAVAHLKRKVEEMERLQVRLLLLLLKEDTAPNSKGATSRSIFRVKFREFLKENMLGTKVHPMQLCPPPVILCFFHCLVRVLQSIWNGDGGESSRGGDAVPDVPYVPVGSFVDGSIDCFEHRRSDDGGGGGGNPDGRLEVRRLGGLASHLRKTYPQECNAVVEAQSEGCSSAEASPRDGTLIEILDGTILLYHIAAHKQLGKMCALRTSMQEYVDAFGFTKAKLLRCRTKIEYEVVKPALVQTGTVFAKKLCEQGRHMAWVRAAVYSQEKQQDVEWLLQVLIHTLNLASQHGNLFTFVPDYYVDACINSCAALTSFFLPSCAPTSEYSNLLTNVSLFLSEHFADKRIVSADVKDNLIQALASFVCKPLTLTALESIPRESRVSLVRKLLQPYENRAWAQSNWILVRFWKGCGLAFRYTQPPHLVKKMGPKLLQVDTALPNQFYKPCPSQLFQSHVAEVLLDDQEAATAFLNSVLNQLNWAFSEFVGTLQEIQNLSNTAKTANKVFDQRQLKICSTCFDLAVALLRVLEMVVHVAPSLFTDWSRSAAEPLLARLCQLLCQVLNRVTSRSGCFDLVIGLEIQGLEAIDHFPIITAVVGILVRLLVEREPKGDADGRQNATQALLSESSFQLSSLDFVLGLTVPSQSGKSSSGLTGSPAQKSKQIPFPPPPTPRWKPPFSLKNYAEVSAAEINQIEQLLQYLWAQQAKVMAETKVLREEDLCPICYANQISTVFQPCGHQSCRACISHQLMNKTECFFCKSNIEMVVDSDGAVLHDLRRKQTTV